jgi:hypothetical protein
MASDVLNFVEPRLASSMHTVSVRNGKTDKGIFSKTGRPGWFTVLGRHDSGD